MMQKKARAPGWAHNVVVEGEYSHSPCSPLHPVLNYFLITLLQGILF
jgi:hypothetical protein